MIDLKKGKVTDIINKNDDVTEVLLDIDHSINKAINYNSITGRISVGDTVYLNTTAGTLSLGTGGYHYVIVNTSQENSIFRPRGHGMKLRYTPSQINVPFTEEENKELKHIYNQHLHLNDQIICFGELHSMLAPLCGYLQYNSNKSLKITYIMTDHGALPLAFSKNVNYLKARGLLNNVITIGNAFGGDFECVNIYTALQTAKALKSDIIIVIMGPGISGTGTRYGFSGLEIGLYMDLVSRLGGNYTYIPRISFVDKRERHLGVSHHTLTILSEITTAAVHLSFPIAKKELMYIIIQQLKKHNLFEKHKITFSDGSKIQAAMSCYNLNITTMGRSIDDDPYYFYSIGSAGKWILSELKRRKAMRQFVQ